MKFQDSSFNGLKVTISTKSVTHARTHALPKSNMPHQLFQSWGHNNHFVPRFATLHLSVTFEIRLRSSNLISTLFRQKVISL